MRSEDLTVIPWEPAEVEEFTETEVSKSNKRSWSVTDYAIAGLVTIGLGTVGYSLTSIGAILMTR